MLGPALWSLVATPLCQQRSVSDLGGAHPSRLTSLRRAPAGPDRSPLPLGEPGPYPIKFRGPAPGSTRDTRRGTSTAHRFAWPLGSSGRAPGTTSRSGIHDRARPSATPADHAGACRAGRRTRIPHRWRVRAGTERASSEGPTERGDGRSGHAARRAGDCLGTRQTYGRSEASLSRVGILVVSPNRVDADETSSYHQRGRRGRGYTSPRSSWASVLRHLIDPTDEGAHEGGGSVPNDRATA